MARTTCLRFATANHPCTLWGGPIVQVEDPPQSCRTLITSIHLRGYGRRPASSHRPIGAPTTRVHRPSFSANHHSFSPPPRSGDLPPLPPVHFPGSTSLALLSERSSLTADSLEALGATNNNTSNGEQLFALAAGSVAGVEPEDKEALGESPAEEPTMIRLQLDASKRRTQVLLSVLAAILIIGLVVFLLWL